MFESPIFPVPAIVVRRFVTRGVYSDFNIFRQALAQEMTQRVLPLFVEQAEAITANWVKQPGFTVGAVVSSGGVHGWVIPFGPGAEDWHRVSRGVHGHWINVHKHFTYQRVGRYKPALRLNRYSPKTFPGGGYGGIGLRRPPTAYRARVWWPGIRPRHFEEFIWGELKGETQRLLENATQRALRAARR